MFIGWICWKKSCGTKVIRSFFTISVFHLWQIEPNMVLWILRKVFLMCLFCQCMIPWQIYSQTANLCLTEPDAIWIVGKLFHDHLEKENTNRLWASKKILLTEEVSNTEPPLLPSCYFHVASLTQVRSCRVVVAVLRAHLSRSMI